MINSTVQNSFAHRIKQLLSKYSDNNYSDFARKIGVSPPSVKRWVENGYEPSRAVLVDIAERLEVDLYWLMTGKGSPDSHTVTQTQANISVEDAIDTLKNMIQESQPKLTEDEAFLLKEFRTLDADQKKLMFRFLIGGFDSLAKGVMNSPNTNINNSFNN